MPKNKILVTGSSGLVGSSLLPGLVEEFEDVYSVEHQLAVNYGKKVTVDLTDVKETEQMLEELKPNTIINLAAATDVEFCEANPQYAELVNHRLVVTLSRYIRKSRLDNNVESYFLHISTDYVFDGTKGNYSEIDPPNPINQYGKTKFLGEKAITSSLLENEWCIARISTPFGIHIKKKTFPIYVLDKLRNNEKVNAVVDQFTSPTYTSSLSEMLLEILKKRSTGIFHVAGASSLSRFDQAIALARTMNLDASLISGISSNEMEWIAKRPKDSSLNVDKAAKHLKHKPEKFTMSLAKFVQDLLK